MIVLGSELVLSNNIISSAFIADNIVVGSGGSSSPVSFTINLDGDELYSDSLAGGSSEVINLNVVIV